MIEGAGSRRSVAGPRRPAPGFTLVELMFAMSVAAILCAVAIPQILTGVDRLRATTAARHLAQQCSTARFHAVTRMRYVAVQFTDAGGDYVAQLIADVNGNGVRAADIANGIDTPLGPPERLSDNFPGVRIALDPALGLGTDPIRLSGSTLLSFSPLGTATAGTVYVRGRDGTQLAVRVLGVTGRTRVLRYQRATATWEEL